LASTFTNLLYHLVFSTRKRRSLIKPNMEAELYRYFGGIIRGEGGVLLEVGGTTDHVHLLAKFKAAMSVSDMLQRIKGNSSKWINERPERLSRFAWQTGYGAFSVSQSQVDAVRRYIQGQKEHHRRVSFREEFVRMLERHGIEYDEQYLWD
jgi:REP element-mobilizing transposase RayT